eukprot:4656749-Pyramimonas_sp.AAC.1
MRTEFHPDFFRQAPARTDEERREEVRKGKRPMAIEETKRHHKHDTPHEEGTPTGTLTRTEDK